MAALLVVFRVALRVTLVWALVLSNAINEKKKHYKQAVLFHDLGSLTLV
jgi:hypothetical protein